MLFCEILLQFKITVFYFNILLKYNLFLRSQLNFQHHYSSLQCHMITSWSHERSVRFALKHATQTHLMKRLSHIVLSVWVRLTDTVPKHESPKQIYFKNFLPIRPIVSYHHVTMMISRQFCNRDITILIIRLHPCSLIVHRWPTCSTSW